MRFWDTSAVVPLLDDEPMTQAAVRQYERDPDIVAWWGTAVECVSAVTRREREGALSPEAVAEALDRLDAISRQWHEVEPGQRVRQITYRLLRVHPLRAADALQLAAAIVASEDHPASLTLITLDDRLGEAAHREGFVVVRPGET